MLGRALVGELGARGHEVVPVDREQLDVTRAEDVHLALDRFRPDWVIQCAAYTAVDAAESDPESAFRVNQLGARIVASECQRIGATFVYPSTDYVFSGEASAPWKPDDSRNPLNVYGASKAAGEMEALKVSGSLVIRTSWLYGAGGRNFVTSIVELASHQSEIEVVADQFGLPTSTRSLSKTVVSLLEERASGIFHASDGGEPVSWFGFATEIVQRLGLVGRIRPVPTRLYPRPARRPLYSVLDCTETEKKLGRKMPDWRSMLQEYIEESQDRLVARVGDEPLPDAALTTPFEVGGPN
jgi:dTDP-4-dehydrorhamnose reductase